MPRYNHPSLEPIGNGHWAIVTAHGHFPLFEVNDPTNDAGFEVFQLIETPRVCDLHVRDKSKLDLVVNDLKSINKNYDGFFKRAAKSMIAMRSFKENGYIIRAQNPDEIALLIYYVDSKLQFTSGHYAKLIEFAEAKPEPEPEHEHEHDKKKTGCTLM